MEEILKAAWLQYGAIGLLALSGWVMWWFRRVDHKEEKKEWAAERAKLREMSEARYQATSQWQHETNLNLRDLAKGATGTAAALGAVRELLARLDAKQ